MDRLGRSRASLSHAAPPTKYIIGTIYSDDHGASWQPGWVTAVFNGSEPTLVELSDGRIIVSPRVMNAPTSGRLFLTGHDGGASFPETRWAAGEDSIYASRVQLIVDYMEPLKLIREQLSIGRDDNSRATFVERKADDIKIDGKLDDEFWKGLPTYELGEVKTGDPMKNKTAFQVAWAGDSLYFAIRCQEESMDELVTPASQEEILPNHGVAGDKPSIEQPWYFNIGRIRRAAGASELSTYAPTGESGFHFWSKFASLQPEK